MLLILLFLLLFFVCFCCFFFLGGGGGGRNRSTTVFSHLFANDEVWVNCMTESHIEGSGFSTGFFFQCSGFLVVQFFKSEVATTVRSKIVSSFTQ